MQRSINHRRTVESTTTKYQDWEPETGAEGQTRLNLDVCHKLNKGLVGVGLIMTATGSDTSDGEPRMVSPARGPSVSAGLKKDWGLIQHKNWDAACRRICSTITYRYQLFILNQADLRVNGPIYNAVKAELKLKADERNVIRWWLVSGRKVYAKSLAQKRQTLTNTTKNLVVGEFS